MEGRPSPPLLRHSSHEHMQDMRVANKKPRVMEGEDLLPQGDRHTSAATMTRWKGKGKSKAKGSLPPGDSSQHLSQQLRHTQPQDDDEEEEEQEEGKKGADGEDENEEVDFLDEAEGLFLECLLAQDIEDDDDDDDPATAAAAEKNQNPVLPVHRKTPIPRSTMDDILGKQYESADLDGAGGAGVGCSSMEESERIACTLQEQEWLRPAPTPAPAATAFPCRVAPAAGESPCLRHDSLPRTGARRWGGIGSNSVCAVRSSRTGIGKVEDSKCHSGLSQNRGGTVCGDGRKGCAAAAAGDSGEGGRLGQASQRGGACRGAEGSGVKSLPCSNGDGIRSPMSVGEKQHIVGKVGSLSTAALGGSPAPCRRITRLSRSVDGDDGGGFIAAVDGIGGGDGADDPRAGVARNAEIEGPTDCFCGLPLNEVPDEIVYKVAKFTQLPRSISTRFERIRVKIVRELVVAALESSAKLPENRALEVEAAIFALFGCCVSKAYKAKARELSFNLRVGKNDPLRAGVLSGSVAPSALVRMSSNELAPLAVRRERERIARRRIKEVTTPRSSPLHTVTDRFSCPECSHEKTHYRTWRRKAVVDRVRVIVQCLQCRYSWEL